MKRNTLAYIIPFLFLIFGYLLALFMIPPDASVLTRFDITATEARLLSLTVTIPLILIWSLALFGLLGISRYAHSIRKDGDGQAFWLISRGLTVLVFGLPLQTLTSSLLNYAARSNPDLLPSNVIFTNYFGLAIVLGGFYIIHKGARRLTVPLKSKTASPHYRLWQFAFVAFSLTFVYLTLSNPARSIATAEVAKATYYLPDWLIILTIVIPYIAVWYLGMQSAYYLRYYRNRVSGVLYKQALGFISNGLAAVILASMLIRFLVNLTELLRSAELKVLLGLIYVLLIAISVGYVLIAIGARKLRKMEEV